MNGVLWRNFEKRLYWDARPINFYEIAADFIVMLMKVSWSEEAEQLRLREIHDKEVFHVPFNNLAIAANPFPIFPPIGIGRGRAWITRSHSLATIGSLV